MELHFWGTAAAEGVPGVFCDCSVCRKAREKGGRALRLRSQIMIDGALLVDFGPDTYANALRYGYDLSKLTDALITHVHEDHFYPSELGNRGGSYAKGVGRPLTLHGPEEMLTLFRSSPAAGDGDVLAQGRVAFDFLKPFTAANVAGYSVTPLPATHGTLTPYVYVVSDGAKTAFICNDSGPLKPSVTEWLASCGKRFDLISFDCTNGSADTKSWGDSPCHMGLPDVVALRRRLQEAGLCDGKTACVVTHFSHNGQDADYDAMLPLAEAEGFVLSYDGLKISV